MKITVNLRDMTSTDVNWIHQVQHGVQQQTFGNIVTDLEVLNVDPLSWSFTHGFSRLYLNSIVIYL